jgi:hypothetical protein
MVVPEAVIVVMVIVVVVAGLTVEAADVPSHRAWPASTPLTCGGPDSLRRRQLVVSLKMARDGRSLETSSLG